MKKLLPLLLIFLLSTFVVDAQTGVLWGTTLAGGTGASGPNYENGVIFSFDFHTNTFTLQHTFSDSDIAPVSALICAHNGLLYGITNSVKRWDGDTGSIYSFNRSTAVTTKLHGFGGRNASGQRDGVFPVAALLSADDGYLYGTAARGALLGGIIYKFDITSGIETVVYNFNTYTGNLSAPTLLQANNGLFYGTCSAGKVFSFNTANDSVLTTADSIFHIGNGGVAGSGVIQVDDSLLFGTTFGPYQPGPGGMIYKINLLTGVVTDVHDFTGGSLDGENSRSSLVRANDGLLYGMTQYGGIYNSGTIYSYNVYTGNETLLHSFGSDTDGRQPYGALIQASDGSLYGTTVDGGTYGIGTIFSYNITSATEKVLYSFDTIHGAWPESALLEIPDNTTAIRNSSGQTQLQIYPNPATNQLFIKTENIQPKRITIYDVNGRMIYTLPFKPEVDVNELSSGVYFVEVMSNEGVARKRFVKM